MIRQFLSATLAAGLFVVPAFVPAAGAATKKADQRPKDATAQCGDGSYSRAKTQQGACSSHGGVKTWYGDPPAPVPATSSTAPSSSSKAATASRPKKAAAPPTAAAATPSGATAQCTDGSYSRAKTQQGACSSHGGVKEWFGESAASTPATSSTNAAPATPSSKPTTSNSRAATPARRSGTTVAAAPTGATAQCEDGSYSSAQSRQGACSGHGGVATWLPNTTAPPAPPVESEVPPADTEVATRAPVTKAPIGARADATAKCKDGTYSFAKHHSGACSHHGGVAEWYK
jgi:hypothetical protein